MYTCTQQSRQTQKFTRRFDGDRNDIRQEGKRGPSLGGGGGGGRRKCEIHLMWTKCTQNEAFFILHTYSNKGLKYSPLPPVDDDMTSAAFFNCTPCVYPEISYGFTVELGACLKIILPFICSRKREILYMTLLAG